MKKAAGILMMLAAPYCYADTKMPDAAVGIGCPSCHAIDHKVVGPAWRDVSKRYRDKRNDPKFVSALVKKVSMGGAGNWGAVPMVANDPTGKNHDKIIELVKFVLALEP
jgi:cytochrome c